MTFALEDYGTRLRRAAFAFVAIEGPAMTLRLSDALSLPPAESVTDKDKLMFVADTGVPESTPPDESASPAGTGEVADQ